MTTTVVCGRNEMQQKVSSTQDATNQRGTGRDAKRFSRDYTVQSEKKTRTDRFRRESKRMLC